MATYNPWQQANRRRQNTPAAPGQYNYDWLEGGELGTAPTAGVGTGDYIPINAAPAQPAASDYPIDFPINRFTPTPPKTGLQADLEKVERQLDDAYKQLGVVRAQGYDERSVMSYIATMEARKNAIRDDMAKAATPAKPTSPWRTTGFDEKTGQAVQTNQETGEIRPVRLEGWTPPPASDSSGAAYANAAEAARHNRWREEVEYPQEQTYKKWAAEELDRNQREQQRMKDEADMRRQQLATTGQWAAAMGNQYMQAIPMAAIPGQTHFLGFEPGGIFETIAKKSGRAYDPDKFRAPIYQYDPSEMWRRAQGNVGGQ